jgi:hypothetical protein
MPTIGGMSETELLTPDEAEQIRDRHAADNRYRVQRERFIESNGLRQFYARDSIVHACLKRYLVGHITFRGALLLAHRALVDRYNGHREMIAKQGFKIALPDEARQTLETVDVEHVIWMAQVCQVVLKMAADAMRSVMPPIILRVRLCANCRDRQPMPRNQSPQYPGHSGPCGDVEVVPS